ncbi:MAG: ATP-binding protein [Anderseniella sp.]
MVLFKGVSAGIDISVSSATDLRIAALAAGLFQPELVNMPLLLLKMNTAHPHKSTFALSRLLQHLLSITIARKITVVVAVSVLVAVLSATGFYVYRQTDQNIAARHGSVTATAQVFAASVAPHLRARDKSAALGSLRAISSLNSIPFVSAHLDDGKVFAALGNAVIVEQGTGLGTISASPGSLGILAMVRNPTLSVSVPAIMGGERIGSVSLLADISDLRRQFFEGIIASLFAGLIASLLGIGVSSRLKRSVTSPLDNLMGVISRVRDEKDLSVRAERVSNDEVGKLVDAFNDMLDQVADRDVALARHRAGLERTVQERTAQLQVAKDAAEAASEAKSTFLATMSHEIRTPMNGMMVMAELLAAGKLPPALQRYANVIVNSGQSLLTIINDLLDLSKIEAGRLQLEKLPVSPRSTIDNVLALFWEQANAAGLQLVSYADPAVPDTFTSDPVRLTQILTNLTNNAIKFTEHGYVGVSARQVNPEDGSGGFIEFTVTDTGIGIEEDKLNSVFEEFSQADTSTTRRFGGTGLGLSICRKLVDAMGGSIRVESTMGKGSRFIVTLPCCDAVRSDRPCLNDSKLSPMLVCLEDRNLASAIANQFRAYGAGIETIEEADLSPDRLSSAGVVVTSAMMARIIVDRYAVQTPQLVIIQPIGTNAAWSMLKAGHAGDILPLPISQADIAAIATAMQSGKLRGRDAGTADAADTGKLPVLSGTRVLVADDNPVNREVIAEVLRQLDVVFDLVEDGSQAVAQWRDERYDLVLMDCSMPIMDGLEATRRIRQEEVDTRRARIPIVALTALIEGRNNAGSWQDAGMDKLVTKPFAIAQIAEAIQSLTTDAAGKLSTTQDGETQHAERGREGGSVPVLDKVVLQGLAEIGAGDPEFVGRMCGLFEENAEPAIARLEQAAGSPDLTQLADAAHALKSMASNLGARRLVSACEAIETAARNNEQFDVAGSLRLVADEIASARLALARYIDAA